MKKIGLYSSEGEIELTITCPESLVALQGNAGLSMIDLAFSQDGVNSYVDNSTFTVKPKDTMPLVATNSPLTADGTDEVIISGIPAGAQVEWPDGQTDIVTGGEIGFSVDLAGTYTFQFTAVPYLNQEIIVEAIPAT